MQKIIIAFLLVVLAVLCGVLFLQYKHKSTAMGYLTDKKTNFWSMESVDTVKFSRDVSRQFLNSTAFDKTIEIQVKAIADSGANYIAIGTPYDQEFIPILKRWVNISRKYKLKIWFRGNFSGWEKWFDYPAISRAEHKKMLTDFILNNKDLFKNGDIFTSCTECENGGPGDPRQTGDIEGHRQFLIDEYNLAQSAFQKIDKSVTANYYPMNLDVAKIIMDPATTQALGGVVVIDHYVKTPEDLNIGVNEIASKSQGKVVLGEFGAPIPDINGRMSDPEQASWLKRAFKLLSRNPNLIGINYWTSFGGSTELWSEDGTPKPAVDVLASFYKPKILKGVVRDEAGGAIADATLVGLEKSVTTDSKGQFYIPFQTDEIEVAISKDGFFPSAITNIQDTTPVNVVLKKHQEDLLFKLQKFLYKTFKI